MLTFGYSPVQNNLAEILMRLDQPRKLVVDGSVSSILTGPGEVRVTQPAASEMAGDLPVGMYWFIDGRDGLLMLVSEGLPGSSEEIAAESFEEIQAHPLALAYQWAEHLWVDAQLVPEPKFTAGDRAITIPEGLDVEIKDMRFSGSQWIYTARGPSGNREQLESRLEPVLVSDDPEQWVLEEPAPVARFGATLTRTKLIGRFADTVYSFRATRTVFRPYQFKPVLKMLNSGQARLLIADEVGLGKTIEAGLIWTELEARRDADRVLIVCPSILVEKWRDEMNERFGFELSEFTREARDNFLEKHEAGNLPKRFAYVASIESLRTWEGLEVLDENPPDFDLVIVDEAHSMRNSDTKSYAVGERLSEWTTGSSLIFLTATPINLGESDLNNLLRLLDPSDFISGDALEAKLAPNSVLNAVGKLLIDHSVTAQDFSIELDKLDGMIFGKAVTLKPQFNELRDLLTKLPLSPRDIANARRLISQLNTLSTTVTRTRRAEVDEKKALRSAEPGIKISWSPIESEFYESFLDWCAQRASAAQTATYFSMQMPIRLASTSLKLAAKTVVQDDPSLWDGDEKQEKTPVRVTPSPELIKLAKDVLDAPDSKLAALTDVLNDLHSQGKQTLLFTWSKANLRYLFNEFEGKFRIAVLNGDVSRQKRREIMRDFRNGSYDFLFANKVASEGLDFEFCSAVINYDLPWNPMEVEQRIGRIDRIGQKSEKILIKNFYNDEAIDSRIMFKILKRIRVFEQSIGELEPIIGNSFDEVRAAIMDFTLTRQQRDEKALQALTAIEAQTVNAKELADAAPGLIISHDVETAELQEELVSSGRYLGQRELAHLLEDWAQSDGADGVTWLNESKSIELVGNTEMAGRLRDITQAGIRNRAETSGLVNKLQNFSPIQISLDQEQSRIGDLDLLCATSPLVMAATGVPGHKHARFSHIRVHNTEVPAGKYVLLLAHAENAIRGGDAIWGSAVNMETGKYIGEGPVDALLAALARGELKENFQTTNADLPRMVAQARFALERRHEQTQAHRDQEETAFKEHRRTSIREQHERKMIGINMRINTLVERGRDMKTIRMAEGKLRHQTERYTELLHQLDSSQTNPVSLSYIAVCTLEVCDETQ